MPLLWNLYSRYTSSNNVYVWVDECMLSESTKLQFSFIYNFKAKL